MLRNKSGKIINISSISYQVAQPQRVVYAISKAGVAHLTRTLALEWAPYNINVNAIAPGITITDLNRKYYEEHPDELKTIVSAIPNGREGYPTDFVGAAILLASDAADYVTGQIITIDGGRSLC